MKKKNKIILYLTVSLVALGIFQSCQKEFENNESVDSSSLSSSTLRTFDPSELNEMANVLESDGITLAIDSSETQTRGIFLNDICVEAVKVSCKTPNPNGDGSYVDMSGVLLVPKKTLFTDLSTLRLMVVAPATYTSNAEAPSNLFKRTSLISSSGSINFFYFFTLQAKTGYAVLIPDYLGFGDSFQQCTHPYLETKPMISSIISLIKKAQNTLSSKGYRYKKEIVVTGYSQGGFIAASLGRELDTNYRTTLPVNLLLTGGTPCNLKQITDIVRASESVKYPYFIPYSLWGFKQNGYPEIDLNAILKEPYASKLGDVFNGTNSDLVVENSFPKETADLYTESFLKNLDTDPNLSYMNDILEENRVKPWINKCPFVMTHGIKDVSVYYQNAKDFADQQNAAGGKVTFYSTTGDHVLAIIPYYTIASTYFAKYK